MLAGIELKSAPPTGAGTDPLRRARAGGSRKGDPWQNTRKRMRTIRNRRRFTQVAPARGRQSGPLRGRIRRSDPNGKLRIRRSWREWPRRRGGQRSSRGEGRPGGGWGGWQVGTAPTPGPAKLCSRMGGLRGPRKNLQTSAAASAAATSAWRQKQKTTLQGKISHKKNSRSERNTVAQRCQYPFTAYTERSCGPWHHGGNEQDRTYGTQVTQGVVCCGT